MNRLQQRNKLDYRITMYIKFLRIATRSQAIQLCKEITDMSAEIEKILNMDCFDELQKIEFSYEIEHSKINCKTTEQL